MDFIKNNKLVITVFLGMILSLAILLKVLVSTGYIEAQKLGSQNCDGLVPACGYCVNGVDLLGTCYSIK